MLPLWKPLIILKDNQNPVLFSETEYKYSEWAMIKGKKHFVSDEHPFVIFYDDNERCYYYIKARGSINPKTNKPRKPNYGEILVYESTNEGLFKKTSYVDCSQIFKCGKDLLESLIDLQNTIHTKTDVLDENVIKDILENMKECVMQVPPYLSILEVKMNKNGETYAKSLYLCQNKIDNIICEMNGDQDDWDYGEENLWKFQSVKNSNSISEQCRYWNGINFCKLFLNEYYPGLVDEFEQVQGIKGVTFKYTPPKLDNIYNNDDEQDDENESNSFSQSR